MFAGVPGDQARFGGLIARRSGDAVAYNGEGIDRSGAAGDRRQPKDNDVKGDRIDRQQRHASPQQTTHATRPAPL